MYSGACFLGRGLGAVGKKLGRESGEFSSEVDFNSLVILDSENMLVIDCALGEHVPLMTDDLSIRVRDCKGVFSGKQARFCPAQHSALAAA